MPGFSERKPIAEAQRMSMAERYEQRKREQEAPQPAPVEDAKAVEAQAYRVAAVEQKQVTARGRAADLIAELRSRQDVPEVPGGKDNVIPFRETRSVVNAQDRATSRAMVERQIAQETRIQSSEASRQNDEKIGAEAYRMALGEKATLERQQYDTKNFDMRSALQRNVEKLKREAAQKEGKFAV
ncbi:MAG: hypothetical protein NUV56_00400 [Candidatus Uhrbacteria bacterium]|nr:hypothetical protein [Candidatus Uhrbacteria bacterium]